MAVTKFFKLLYLEFSDLEDEFNTLIDSITKRHENREITNYVMIENSSLLKRELTDMILIHQKITELKPEDYSTLEDATKAVIDEIYGLEGIPEAVHLFMEKRVRKVLKYLEVVN